MNNLEKLVEAVIKDLKAKIEALQETAKEAGAPDNEKAEEIKEKAIKVLNEVADKASRIPQESGSVQEAVEAVQMIKTKSAELYSNAYEKIIATAAEYQKKPVKLTAIQKQIRETLDSWLSEKE